MSATDTHTCMISGINDTSPIGIFDSGIGGLTVVRAVQKLLPNEDIIYFGDTARVPYGIKSMDTVRHYSMQITNFLLDRGVKLILIACNTAAAAAEQHVKSYASPVPVLGVVESGSKAAVDRVHGQGKVAVLGTLATIGSGTYEQSLKAKNPQVQVFSRACPLLVPLAEEGWTDNDVSRATLEVYLKDIKAQDPDAVILGCTHYPLFKEGIRKYLNADDEDIIDSADAIAEAARNTLSGTKMLNPKIEAGQFHCYVSDKPQRFQQLAERFLGHPIHRLEIVEWD